MDDLRHWYQTLGLEPGASPDEVKQAFRTLAGVWHPDRFIHDTHVRHAAEEKFKEIAQAYAQLRSHFASADYRSPDADEETETRTDAAPEGEHAGREEEPDPSPHETEIGQDSPAAEVLGAFPRRWAERPVTTLVACTAIGCVAVGATLALLSSLAPSVGLDGAASAHATVPGPTPLPDAVSLEPEPPESLTRMAELGYFTLGSSKQQVHRVQGRPTSITGDVWWYDDAYVSFANGRVAGYDDAGGRLRVALEFEPAGDGPRFRLGSSPEQVLAAQGTPTSVTGDIWWYGGSFVEFERDRVSRFSNAGNLRTVR